MTKAKKVIEVEEESSWNDFYKDGPPREEEEVLWYIKTQYLSPYFRVGNVRNGTLDLHVRSYDIKELKKDVLARVYWSPLPNITHKMRRAMGLVE